MCCEGINSIVIITTLVGKKIKNTDNGITYLEISAIIETIELGNLMTFFIVTKNGQFLVSHQQTQLMFLINIFMTSL